MSRTGKLMVRRHGLMVRLTHWLNVVVLAVMLTSGLQIFNAHPALYWGDRSTFADPWLSMTAHPVGDALAGYTRIGDRAWETTGVLGASDGQARGFPAWSTLPSYRSLADGRRWHLAFAWLFVLNGLVYVSTGLANRHIARDLLPRRGQLSPGHLWREIKDHARFRYAKGEAARSYNALQKLAYLAVLFGLLPLMVVTGLCMSPGFNAGFPWLLELFGGRQSARTIHFLSASGIVLFVIVHLVQVAASGLFNNLRSMITGRYAIEAEDAR